MFRLAHLSDVHLAPLPPFRRRDLLSKRVTGYVNWRRGRGAVHDPRVLDAVVDHLRNQAPDHIAITGDLVNLSLPQEFPRALEWLRSLGSPDMVSVVPGNHDAYVALPEDAGLETWSAYMTGDGAASRAHVDRGPSFPFVRRYGRISLIGLSSAVPTPWFMATGRLGSQQIRDFRKVMEQERSDNQMRIVLIHHPPHPWGTKAHKRLSDTPALLEAIHDCGADLIIYGHNHRFALDWLRAADTTCPAVGVLSASARCAKRHTPGGYHLFDISPGSPPHIRLSRFSVGADYTVRSAGEPLLLAADDQNTIARLLELSIRVDGH